MGFPLTVFKEQMLKNRFGRECGPCTACCTTIAVKELNKDRGTKCVHEAGSCTIYESRPECCRQFECMWLSGFIEGDERRRPDHLGLIFVPSNNEKLPVIACWECFAGAAERNIHLLKKLATKFIIYVLPFGQPIGWKVMGPPQYRAAIEGMIRQAAEMSAPHA